MTAHDESEARAIAEVGRLLGYRVLSSFICEAKRVSDCAVGHAAIMHIEPCPQVDILLQCDAPAFVG